MMHRISTERGAVTVLALGLALVVFATAGLAVDGTRAYIYRIRLQNLADSAALAAANRIDVADYHRIHGAEATVDVHAAREVVRQELSALPGEVAAETSATEEGVAIRLSASIPTSFLGLVGIRRLTVVADATARPIVGPVPR